MFLLLTSLAPHEMSGDPCLHGFLIEDISDEHLEAVLDKNFAYFMPGSFRKRAGEGQFKTLDMDGLLVDWVFKIQEVVYA